jgi:nitroreductase
VLVSSSEPKFPNIQYANIACVIENMLLAATDAGIDSVYLWGPATVIAQNSELRKELGIPDGFTPVSGAALGYAIENNPAEKTLGITLAVNYV